MPKTYVDLRDLHRRAHRHLPAGRLLVEGRDPRRCRSQLRRRRATTPRSSVVGSLGAFMTAAYMTRCIYLTFFGEYRGDVPPRRRSGDAEAAETSDELDHADDPHVDDHHASPRVRAAHPRPALHPVVPRHRGRIHQPPRLGRAQLGARRRSRCGSSTSIEPQGRLLPRRAPVVLAIPSSHIGVAVVEHDRRARSASASPTPGTSEASVRTASPSATSWRAPVTRCSSTSTTSTPLHRHHRRCRSRAPSPRAANWFNQNVLDGIVERCRNRRLAGAANGSTTTSTRASSTASSTAPGAAAEGCGQVLRQMQTGKVQQYGALLFAATAVLAGIFIIVI